MTMPTAGSPGEEEQNVEMLVDSEDLARIRRASRTRCRSLCWAFVLVSTIALVPFVVQSDEGTGLRSGTVAKRISKGGLKYPRRALDRGLEGWVELSFVVDPSGETTDVVIEDVSGDEGFAKEAEDSVRRWKYEAGTLNGKPVEQCHTRVVITFQLARRKQGATRSFIRRFKTIMATIETDPDEAASLIQDLEERPHTNLYERSRLWLLHAVLQGKSGDPKAQLASLRRATISDGEFLEADVYARLLVKILGLELAQQEFGRAMLTYERIQGLGDKAAPIPASIQKGVDGLASRREGGPAFGVRATLPDAPDGEEFGRWSYTPVGRMPGIGQVDGHLEEVDIRCEGNRVKAAPTPDRAWRIPDEWGRCAIYVTGTPGTTFQLVEHFEGSA